jgi:hypothetical protein
MHARRAPCNKAMTAAGILTCGLLAGCQSWSVGYGSGAATAPLAGIPAGSAYAAQGSVSITSGTVAGIAVAVMLAEGVRYYAGEADGSLSRRAHAPEPDPRRRISVQDCTQPIDLDGGNLSCR